MYLGARASKQVFKPASLSNSNGTLHAEAQLHQDEAAYMRALVIESAVLSDSLAGHA
jgi:hypothetical protein